MGARKIADGSMNAGIGSGTLMIGAVVLNAVVVVGCVCGLLSTAVVLNVTGSILGGRSNEVGLGCSRKTIGSGSLMVVLTVGGKVLSGGLVARRVVDLVVVEVIHVDGIRVRTVGIWFEFL